MKTLYFLVFLMLFVLLNSCQDDIIEPKDEKTDDIFSLSRSTPPYVEPLRDMPIVDFYEIYDFEKSTLKPYQKEMLFNYGKLALALNPCLCMMMKHLHYNLRVKIKFEINPRINGLARFDSSSGTISFRDESCIEEVEVLIEELLHVFQCYCFNMTNVNKNAEYEVKVIRDVLNYLRDNTINSFYGISGEEISQYQGTYKYWLYEMVVLERFPQAEEFDSWFILWRGENRLPSATYYMPALLQWCLSEIYLLKK